MTAPGFALEVDEHSFRQQDAGLTDQFKAWQQWLEEQRQQRQQATPIPSFSPDALTGISPGAYTAGLSTVQSNTNELILPFDETPPSDTDQAIALRGNDSLPVGSGLEGILGVSASPVAVTVDRDSASVQALKASSTKLWSVEARSGGRSTYEVAIGPNGAQADLHEQMEYVWQNGQDVLWSLEQQGSQVVFTMAGKSIRYPAADTAALNAFSLLTKVNTKNASKVSPGTSMAVSIQSVNGEAVSEPITLASVGPENGQDLDELFFSLDGTATTITGTMRLSWPTEGVNPYQKNSQSRVTFKLSGYQASSQPLNPPTGIDLSANQVIENSGGGTVIGQLSTDDPDGEDSHVYTLLDDAGGRFEIVDDRLQVNANATLDFEAQTRHTILVRSTDASDLSITETFTIEVLNQNEAPQITSTPVEDGDHGEPYAYELTAIDPDAGDTLSFATEPLPDGLTLTDNGDGSALLSGTVAGGIYDIDVTVQDREGLTDQQSFVLRINHHLHLQERTDFSPSEQVSFMVPETPSILRFVLTPEFDTSDPDRINDAVEVAIVDAQGQSLVHTLSSKQQTTLNWTEGEDIQLAPGVAFEPATGQVEVNLVGLDAGQEFTVVFSLVNNDGDSTTQVYINDLTLEDAPTGMTAPLLQGNPTPNNQRERPNFNALEDVSDSVEAVYRLTSFNEQTHLLYAAVQLQNDGSYSLDAPLLVAVDRISDPQVQLQNPDGYTPDGLPYYDFSHLVIDGKLNPSDVTASRNFVFYNPNQVQFSYDLTILSVINQGPYITSQPRLEVIGGQLYRYDVDATDPDGDTLSYQLLSAPDGMSIDERTGAIDWETDAEALGNYSVIVEVSDGHGETALQQFSLAVIGTPSNRPPIFTSTPEVDAFINQLYRYDADAVDADQDELLYGLIVGPDGMSVNPLTGQVEWMPPPVLTLGDTVLGTIRVPGEQHEFAFSGQIGQQLYFDPLQYTGNFRDWTLKVYSPSGQEILNTHLNVNRLLTLTENGNYKIVLDVDGAQTGGYGFSVIDLDVVPHIMLDTLVEGTLGPGSEDDVYRFTGQAGQHVFLDDVSKSGTLDWQLYDPYGNAMAVASRRFTGTGYIEVTLPHDGDYILALKGTSGFTNTADYAFKIITPDRVTQAIAISDHTNPQAVYGELQEKGEVDVYTFTGQVGQRLYFDQLFVDIGGRSSYYRATIYSPTGKPVLNWTDGAFNAEPLPITLAEAGTYELQIDARDEDTGTYSFSLLDLASATPIDSDTPQSGVLDSGQELHLYEFSAAVGQRLYFDTASDDIGATWTLFTSGNVKETEANISSDIEYVFDTADRYILAIRGANGTIPFHYGFEIITPDALAIPLTLNEPVTAQIREKGEQDIYTFTGSQGQRLFFDVLTDANGTQAKLLAPSQSVTGLDTLVW
ncbi:putative Ig domain-containing protein [Vacuolonema iberomarrocanum]|uniref:putative Ig domain-containing protein n=1 Tax=Vacuolonema iberomarrocanum TaxID=3454632 RepID=UPI003F6DFF30